MAKQRSTIRQVAARAKVSVATVSRALQCPERVAQSTLHHVRAVVRELGYTPNAQARVLRTSKTCLVIALVPDIANPFFAQVIRGIEQVAHANGYSVLLGDTQSNPIREQHYANMVEAGQADGLISLVPRLPSMSGHAPLPLVNACEYVRDANIAKVYADNIGGARAAVAHLISLGHRQIAHISGPKASAICGDRRHGYETALAHAQIKLNRKLVVNGDFTIESGMWAVERLLEKKHAFTAIFCANDEMAIGAMEALGARGLRTPEDVSVTGFDDIQFARFTKPALTTVSQPKNDLGRESMMALLEILQNAECPVRDRMLPTELIVRGSTAPVRSS